MKRFHRCFMALGVAVLMAGCVSTPARRIEQNAALFGTFPPEVQASVRKGEIAVGFTKDMVLMALGPARQVYARTTHEGASEVWIYTGSTYTTSMEPVDNSFWYRDRQGRLRNASGLGWASVQHRSEYPYLRVEFESSAVKAIERLK
jgi:hypothetical protein